MVDHKSKKQSIENNKQKPKDRKQQYKHWVILIVKSVEQTGDLIEEAEKAYEEFISRYPHAKPTLDRLVEEVRLFSVYDDEAATVNFNYSAYLQQIQKLVE